MYRTAIEGSLVPLNHRVMAIDSDAPVIVRDGKGEDLPVQLFLALHISKKYKTSESDAHALDVLAIGKIKSRGAAFDLAGEERELHSRSSHEIGSDLKPWLTHKGFKLVQLFLENADRPNPTE